MSDFEVALTRFEVALFAFYQYDAFLGGLNNISISQQETISKLQQAAFDARQEVMAYYL